MNIITELWNGNLKPIKNLGKNNEELHHLENLLKINLKNLDVELNDKGEKLLSKYNDCLNEYLGIICEQAFSDGFSLGIRITAKAFAESDKVIQN